MEKVGGARYITTLDLSKGYWQLALAPEAKELTAFKTRLVFTSLKLCHLDTRGHQPQQGSAVPWLFHGVRGDQAAAGEGRCHPFLSSTNHQEAGAKFSRPGGLVSEVYSLLR